MEDDDLAVFNPDVYLNLLAEFLKCDLYIQPTPEQSQTETLLLKKMNTILSDYQEQPYLLDPYLECMVVPPIEHLKNACFVHVNDPVRPLCSERFERLSSLIYECIKCRGYKTIIRFFPHQVVDIPVALGFMHSSSSPVQEATQWPLRYIVLLWLGLVCMIPFDLKRFDSPGTDIASDLHAMGLKYLGTPGLEREGAALLLARLYSRHVFSFICKLHLSHGIPLNSSYQVLGILRIWILLCTSADALMFNSYLSSIQSLNANMESDEILMINPLVRRLRTKLVSKSAIRLFPSGARQSPQPPLKKAKIMEEQAPEDEDEDVPESIEESIDFLLQTLQDKDTTVRWSASKGLARIAACLPGSLASQILESILRLFEIHSSLGNYDLPALAEASWHGGCLACAEMARRGLVSSQNMPTLVKWISKALYFDIRKGSHSIGSSVRDAASYVVWSLARSIPLTLLECHAADLARHLVAVSVFDREVQIRRAASAAFQEFVGRTNLIPDGIEVLRKTDFYSVSMRRNAFLVAAPQVAEHFIYRECLLEHIVTVTLRHWDVAMRQLGAESLRLMASLDLNVLGPVLEKRLVRLLGDKDVIVVHGSLLGLSELALAFRENGSEDLEKSRLNIFKSISMVSPALIQKHRNETIMEASCIMLSNSLSPRALAVDTSQPKWRTIFDICLRHRTAACQVAASRFLTSLSAMKDVSYDVQRYLRTTNRIVQQSIAQALGGIRFDVYPNSLSAAVEALQSLVMPKGPHYSLSVETRRNAFNSLSSILCSFGSGVAGKRLEPSMVVRTYRLHIDGMQDYTIDERGDVGSWIRIACIDGLVSISQLLLQHVPQAAKLLELLPPDMFHEAVGALFKQGVERLDNVRQRVGERFASLIDLSLRLDDLKSRWRISGDQMIQKLLFSSDSMIGWHDGSWLFPRVVRLMAIHRYRQFVFRGLVLSIGSKTDTTQRPVSIALSSFVESLPVQEPAEDTIDLVKLLQELLAMISEQMTNNNVVIPALQTLLVILDSPAILGMAEREAGNKTLQALLDAAGKFPGKLKNIQRIETSAKVVVFMIAIPGLASRAIEYVFHFLEHHYPKIRSDTAESLYLLFQTRDVGFDTSDAEEILLETDWYDRNVFLDDDI
ncbi:TBCD protein [Sistotremastrum niveocremeum HHB9708]|uniref:TBCD protein n=1 Tax=Sistotremastrum niveocremeum HHB9708 TaxID=1314777 RepID=A0A164RE58_9AGAM|nr:TBCD protein [Sistotremastrum niveocremeum HHB9708]